MLIRFWLLNSDVASANYSRSGRRENLTDAIISTDGRRFYHQTSLSKTNHFSKMAIFSFSRLNPAWAMKFYRGRQQINFKQWQRAVHSTNYPLQSCVQPDKTNSVAYAAGFSGSSDDRAGNRTQSKYELFPRVKILATIIGAVVAFVGLKTKFLGGPVLCSDENDSEG